MLGVGGWYGWSGGGSPLATGARGGELLLLATKSRGFLGEVRVDKKSDRESMAADGKSFSACFAFCSGAAATSSWRRLAAKSTTLLHTRPMLPLISRGASLRSLGSAPVALLRVYGCILIRFYGCILMRVCGCIWGGGGAPVMLRVEALRGREEREMSSASS